MSDRSGLYGYVKFLLFLSSYIPLFVVLAILHYTNILVVAAMAIIIGLTLLFLVLMFKLSERLGNYHGKITDFENINDMSLEYIITYIFPLLFLNYSSISVLLALTVIFMTIGYIYISSDLIYMNPILNLLGYNIYKGQVEGKSIIIISKRDAEDINRNKLVQLANKVYLGR